MVSTDTMFRSDNKEKHIHNFFHLIVDHNDGKCFSPPMINVTC